MLIYFERVASSFISSAQIYGSYCPNNKKNKKKQQVIALCDGMYISSCLNSVHCQCTIYKTMQKEKL